VLSSCQARLKSRRFARDFYWVLGEQTIVPIDATRYCAPQCMLARVPNPSHSHDSVTSSPTSDWFVITFHD
jgi:hypothetical protein